MPYFDPTAIQRGLSDLGNALGRQRQMIASQQVTAAKLKTDQMLNDKVAEFNSRQNFDGDWGTDLRTAAEQIVAEAGKAISDPMARDSFHGEALSSIEQMVPKFREVQTQKMTQYVAANEDAADQDAIKKAASGDWATASTALDLRYGADGLTPTIIQVSGGPQQAARRRASVIDQAAAAYADSKVGAILGDTSTSWAEKLGRLRATAKDVAASFDYSVQPSQEAKDKIDAALAGNIAKAQGAAIQEHKQAGFDQLAKTVSLMSPGWSAAKISGQAFDPTAGLRDLLRDPGLDEDVRKATNTALRELTLEADKSLSTEATSKALAANLDSIKNRIQAYMKQGANADFIDGKIVGWLQEGGATGLDPRNYSEAVAYAKGAVTLGSDPVLQGVMKTAFGNLAPAIRNKLEVRFQELAGGLYNKGDPDAFKADGRWDANKLKAAADDMVKAERSDALKTILEMNFGTPTTAEPNEAAEYVKRAVAGKLIGQVDAGNVAQKAAPFTDALWNNLKGRLDIPQGRPIPTFNLYTKAGLPTFKWDDGTTATPDSVDGKIVWDIKHPTVPAAPNPNKKGY